MRLKGYVFLWLGLSMILFYEGLMLGQNPTEGIFGYLKSHFSYFKNLNLSPEPGRAISLYYGWVGFALILTTNLYVFRKRMGILKNLGRVPNWLNFHIFCGLLGPTFIVFHCNFTVRGLVSISFWSMIIVAVSGIIGRYFYIQVTKVRADLNRDAIECEKTLEGYEKSIGPKIPAHAWRDAKYQALQLAGGHWLSEEGVNPMFITALFASMMGDIRLKFTSPSLALGMPDSARGILERFALAKRQAYFYEIFNRYLGYWHSFHMPFAFFMYIIAAIHVAAARQKT